MSISPVAQKRALALRRILDNQDDVELATLGWNESVTYTLEPLARLVFAFLEPGEADGKGGSGPIRVIDGKGNDVTSQLSITRGPFGASITVTIKPNTPPWTGKATFRFRDRVPAADGGAKVWFFDPPIKNRGS